MYSTKRGPNFRINRCAHFQNSNICSSYSSSHSETSQGWRIPDRIGLIRSRIGGSIRSPILGTSEVPRIDLGKFNDHDPMMDSLPITMELFVLGLFLLCWVMGCRLNYGGYTERITAGTGIALLWWHSVIIPPQQQRAR